MPASSLRSKKFRSFNRKQLRIKPKIKFTFINGFTLVIGPIWTAEQYNKVATADISDSGSIFFVKGGMLPKNYTT